MYEENLLHLQPDFYDRFRCRAAACRHSCCKGWEIDIDENTLDLYRSLSGSWREKMDAAIICDEYGAHFRLTEDERCPFLQQDGLCELIRALGEEALCDICALHPRFYENAGPYELAGLGLSCEAVCDLLLSEEGELTLRCEETGEQITLSTLLKTLGCEEEEGVLRFTPTGDLNGMLLRLEQRSRPDRATTACYSILSIAVSNMLRTSDGGLYWTMPGKASALSHCRMRFTGRIRSICGAGPSRSNTARRMWSCFCRP